MKQLIYILTLFFIFSCGDSTKKPENFISKEAMIALLVDMKIANKTKNIKNIDLKKNINYMEFIYNKHHVDSTRFKENNAYYIKHLEIYTEIYTEVDKRLKDSIAKYEKQLKITDSVKKSKLKKMIPSDIKLKAERKRKTSILPKKKKLKPFIK